VHANETLDNPDKDYGAHIKPKTKYFNFADVTLGVLNDEADLSRVDDQTYR
jgi:hypothetical protein